MRKYVVLAALLMVGCTDKSKDKQIAELQKKLQDAEKEKTRSTAKTAGEGQQENTSVDSPPPTPAPSDESPQDSMIARIASGKTTDADVSELLKQAAENKSITYAHLKKNADKYKQKAWRLRGRILEISEKENVTTGRVDLSDYDDQAVMFECKCETEFVQNNVVEMVGILAGNISYTSTAGWNITIPALVAAKITKPGKLDGGKKTRIVEND